MTSSRRADWLVPTALIALTLIPVAGGAIRLTDLTGGEVTPENARFFASPVPVVLHIVTAVVFCLGGAVQFSPAFRGRNHRRLGRVLLPAGLLMALTGLWMTLFYPYPEGDGDLLAAFRLVAGSTTVLALVLGFRAIRRRDLARHRAWMIRGYALAQGAGTQALVTIAWVVLVGPATGSTRTLLLGLAWVINAAVAEWVIGEPGRRRRALYRTRPAERTA
ncbi:DUF2306 domain-containing protein [Saccharothrix sp. S26]|uniref:DUF2306 domain-containing protein n=1 Tax=Saccharothrix sp. S26 TaxID=2907215 RepID=UPI001F1B7FEA|nr:DUF2306 domain-containing protein [Saccharothrix sp. S26]MCE6993347.1 DUF2306 domain-containing protein [Saccharothrix sp. S26]